MSVLYLHTFQKALPIVRVLDLVLQISDLCFCGDERSVFGFECRKFVLDLPLVELGVDVDVQAAWKPSPPRSLLLVCLTSIELGFCHRAVSKLEKAFNAACCPVGTGLRLGFPFRGGGCVFVLAPGHWNWRMTKISLVHNIYAYP